MGSVKRRVPAEGEIRKVTWRAKYTRPDNGKQVSHEFETKRDAAAWLAAQEAKIQDRDWTDPALGRETLGSFWDRYHARAEEIGRPAPSTLSKYRTVMSVHVAPALGHRKWNSITKADVQDLVDATAMKSTWQAEEALKLMRMLGTRAVAANLITRNPGAGVKAPATEGAPIRVLTPQQITGVVEALPDRWRAFVLLDAYSSLRWSELVALKRDDIDLEARTVRVDEALVEVRGKFVWGRPKTMKSRREIDLPEVIIRPMAEHMLRYPPLLNTEDPNHEGLVFFGEKGGPVRRHVFRKIWKTACTEAGVEGVRPGWMRHTGASLGYHVTKDMKATAQRLGHTSVRMVDTVYVELYDEASRAVADGIDAMIKATGKIESG